MKNVEPKHLAAAEQLIADLERFDEITVLVLNGHLILDRLLTEGIENFVLHPSKLDGARLSFSQKLQLARSMSTSSQDSTMWKLIEKVNRVRNVLAHGDTKISQTRAFEALRSQYFQEFPSVPGLANEKMTETMLWVCAIAATKGFLVKFCEEVGRLKEHVIALDKVLNDGQLSGDR